MILSFRTNINGKPTMFTNKIVKGMWQNQSSQMNEFAKSNKLPDYYVFEDLTVFQSNELTPKIHTIREDKNDRWKAGIKIDFFINCRQKDMFRFAPVLPVVSVQNIEIYWTYKYRIPHIIIDGHPLLVFEHLKLAQNDGFVTPEDLYTYFNEDFTGKLIHWTDLKY